MRHAGILQELKRRLLAEFGSEVTRVLVYGSVARGDDREDSDIDVLVVFRDSEQMAERWKKARRMTFDLGFDQNLLISILTATEEDFQELVTPFLMNVRKEAVAL